MKPEIITIPSFQSLREGLLNKLVEKSYSAGTLDNYRRFLRRIEVFMIDNGINTYTPCIGKRFFENDIKPRNLARPSRVAVEAVIRRLDDYCSGGSYVYNKIHVIDSLPDGFERVLDAFSEHCVESGNKPYTVNHKRRFSRHFLLDCISAGCPDIDSLNHIYVCKACAAIENKDGWAAIRTFLKFLYAGGFLSNDLSTFVPHYRRGTVIPVTYSEEETFQFEKTIDRSSNTGKRDYAMLLLATRLGIRSGDIAKLTLDELDFEGCEIQFNQQKTGSLQRLSMIPEVKTALLDYINNGRQTTTINTVFLRCHAPYLGISTSAIRFATTKYFSAAGINTHDKKHGPHTFRSSLASSMINSEVPYEAVRRILGHIDPNSVKHYAKLDVEKLRECAIKVPKPSGLFKRFLEGGGF